MRIFAVYKTFRGHEFARESLLSIYPIISGALFVHEDIGWMGRTGNTVRAVVKTIPDPDNKIYHLDLKGQVKQDDQYNAAVEWLESNNVKYDYLFLIDSDEVWGNKDLGAALSALDDITRDENTGAVNCVRCRLYEHIKSPFYRVDPPTNFTPVSFVLRRAVKKDSLNLRGANIKPGLILPHIFWYHFPMVRSTLTEVLEKQKDSNGIESEPMVDMDFWVMHVWNRLPTAINVEPHEKLRGYWKGIKVIGLDDLPEIMHNNPIVKAWQKYPTARYGYSERVKSCGDILVKYGLPHDFGPGHPDWNTPSKQNKYRAALIELVPKRKG
jgi:hypothetical protein